MKMRMRVRMERSVCGDRVCVRMRAMCREVVRTSLMSRYASDLRERKALLNSGANPEDSD